MHRVGGRALGKGKAFVDQALSHRFPPKASFTSSLFDPRRRHRHGWGGGALSEADNLFDRMTRDFFDHKSPLSPFRDFSRELERGFFGDVMHRHEFATDLVEHDDRYVMEVEVPGVAKEDIHIKVTDGQLVLKVERKEEKKEEEDGKIVRSERSYGRMERSYALPHSVNADEVSAKNENGVLTITIPKKEAVVDNGRIVDIE